MGPQPDKTARRSPLSRARKRLRELERIIKARHGTVPCTDDADLYLLPVARCFRKIMVDNGKPVSVDEVMNRFGLWCETWAPNLTSSQAADIVSQVLAEPAKIDRDDELGASLRLPYAERLRLKITTIGSYDVDRKSRKELAKTRRRERDRRRAEKKRRASGARSRSEDALEQSPGRRTASAAAPGRGGDERRPRQLKPHMTQVRRPTLLSPWAMNLRQRT